MVDMNSRSKPNAEQKQEFVNEFERACLDLFTAGISHSDLKVDRVSSLLCWRDTQAVMLQLIGLFIANQEGLLPGLVDSDSTRPIRMLIELIRARHEMPLEAVGLFRESRLMPRMLDALLQLKEQPSITRLESVLMDLIHETQIGPELLARLAETLYGQYPSFNNGKWMLQDTVRRRDRGAFFTPEDLVAFIVQETLSPLLDDCRNPEDVLRLKIVDPACGAGTFLLNALRVLAERYRELAVTWSEKPSPKDARRLVAENCLRGVDLDPLVVDVARTSIWLSVADPGLELKQLEQTIVVGDALLDSRDQYEDEHARTRSNLLARGINWAEEFPQVFEKGELQDRGFDAVLVNPPWGRMKPELKDFFGFIVNSTVNMQGVDLHSFLRRKGYLSKKNAAGLSWTMYEEAKREYAELLKDSERYAYQRVSIGDKLTGGDADLYKYFMELSFNLVRNGGRIGLIVPSSFYQTQGAAGVRNLYFRNGCFEGLFVFQNRERIFPIHSMYKFLIGIYQKGGRRNGILDAQFELTSPLELSGSKTKERRKLGFSNGYLQKATGELMIVPEVRTVSERHVLEKLFRSYEPLGRSEGQPWHVSFRREFDMSRDSYLFLSSQSLELHSDGGNDHPLWSSDPDYEGIRPLYEGRMVNQFDHAAKAYRGGNGRAAKWDPLPLSQKKIQPHYYLPITAFEDDETIALWPRAGFCDVTGQYNERTVLAAVIPAGLPAGNKVPTLRFNRQDIRLHYLWVAIANSFVVDWILRRLMSTTLNFFHWEMVPFPRLDPDSDVAGELIRYSAMLSIVDNGVAELLGLEHLDLGNSDSAHRNSPTYKERASLRAAIDTQVAAAYSLTLQEYALILDDFPLLDRHQPPIPLGSIDGGPYEERSTVTRDFALEKYSKHLGHTSVDLPKLGIESPGGCTDVQERLSLADKVGATPYVPSEQAPLISEASP